jgi:hypothetical protein
MKATQKRVIIEDCGTRFHNNLIEHNPFISWINNERLGEDLGSRVKSISPVDSEIYLIKSAIERRSKYIFLLMEPRNIGFLEGVK